MGDTEGEGSRRPDGLDSRRARRTRSGAAPRDHAPARRRHLREFAARIGHLRHPRTCGPDCGPCIDRLMDAPLARELPLCLHLRETVGGEAGVRRVLRLRARRHRPRRRRGDRLALPRVGGVGRPRGDGGGSLVPDLRPSFEPTGHLPRSRKHPHRGVRRQLHRHPLHRAGAARHGGRHPRRLAIAVVASAPRIVPANYTPFLPNGIASIGTAAALIVWSYLGYENTSNVAEEFRNPERDFHRSVVISVLLISGLYLAVAVVTVGTGAYTVGGGATPFAAMLSDAFGAYGGMFVALLAVFVTFGTVNAYVAGMARVYYAAARDGVFPRALAAVDRRTGVPHHALVFLIVLVLLSLLAFYVLNVDFVSAFLMASGAAILTYVIGSVAGIRLLHDRGMRRALPWISLGVSVAVVPFKEKLLEASVTIAGVGLLASWALSRRRGANSGT